MDSNSYLGQIAGGITISLFSSTLVCLIDLSIVIPKSVPIGQTLVFNFKTLWKELDVHYICTNWYHLLWIWYIWLLILHEFLNCILQGTDLVGHINHIP